MKLKTRRKCALVASGVWMQRIGSWKTYSPTPLIKLNKLEEELKVKEILYKDVYVVDCVGDNVVCDVWRIWFARVWSMICGIGWCVVGGA